jgi:hypothetical protein
MGTMAFDKINAFACLQRRGPFRIFTGFPVRQSTQREPTDHQCYSPGVLSERKPFVKRVCAPDDATELITCKREIARQLPVQLAVNWPGGRLDY